MVTPTDLMIWVISIDSKLGFSHDNLGTEKKNLVKKKSQWTHLEVLVLLSGLYVVFSLAQLCLTLVHSPIQKEVQSMRLDCIRFN